MANHLRISQTAIKAKLKESGTLREIKSRIRAEIFSVIDEKKTSVAKSDHPIENAILNEIIREYFKFNGYTHSLSVFEKEVDLEKRPPFDRDFLASEVGIDANQSRSSLPLLYTMRQRLKRRDFDRKRADAMLPLPSDPKAVPGEKPVPDLGP